MFYRAYHAARKINPRIISILQVRVHLQNFSRGGGVVGVCVGDKFSEESNFHISQVLMKVKLSGSEAGWIVNISEVEHGSQ